MDTAAVPIRLLNITQDDFQIPDYIGISLQGSLNFTDIWIAVEELCTATDKQFDEQVTIFLQQIDAWLSQEKGKKLGPHIRLQDSGRIKVFLYATACAVCRYNECLSSR